MLGLATMLWLVLAPAAGDAAPQKDPRYRKANAATTLWAACAEGTSARLAVSSVPTEALVDETFKICSELEPLVHSEMKAAGIPVAAFDQVRQQFRERIPENIGSVRAFLNLPRGAR